MLKLTFCLHRLPSLSREEFQAYWYDNHAPLVTKHREALRIAKYTQTHASPLIELAAGIQQSRGAPDQFDGVAELFWHSKEDIIATFDDPAARAAGIELLEDEKKFIDLARSPLWYNEERPIFG